MHRSKVEKQRRETERYRQLVGFCVMCRGSKKFMAMPGSTTCLKHKPPARRNLMRRLMNVN